MRSTPLLAPPGRGSPAIARRLWLAVPLLFAALVWAPILRNYFFGDDLLNLYWIVNKGLLEYLITPYGGHLLATRNAIYALCFRLFGTDVRWYFALVLATHLVNVVLLFRAVRVLTHSPRLACLGATLWGISPLNEGALGWYSVYGHVLVATIFLWLLDQLARIGDGRPPGRWVPWSWAALLLVASTSFGVGIAVTLAWPLVTFLILPSGPLRTRLVAVLAGVALLIVALYFGLYRLAATLYPSSTVASERLGMMLGSLKQGLTIADLLLHLVGFGLSNLLLGPFAVWAPYRGWVSTAAIAVFALAVGWILVRGSAALRRRLLACLVMGVAAYAIIAAGRVYFLNVRADLVAQTPRYHYLAPVPLTVALCLSLSQLQAWRPLGRSARDAVVAAWLVATALGFVARRWTIDAHALARQATEQTVAQIQSLIDAAPPGRDVYIENRPFAGVGPFLIFNPKMFPGWAAAFTVFYPDNTVAGRRVFFVVDDPAVRAAAADGRRIGGLLVAPEDAPNRSP